MNTLRIILKEFRQSLRNYKANTMMIIFPIVLIIILGAAFSKSFDKTIKLDDIRILYTEKIDANNHYLTDAFQKFRGDMSKNYGVAFEKTEDVNEGMESIEGYKYTGYVLVSDDPQEIKLYNNKRFGGYNTVIVESAFRSFTDTYKAMEAIAVNNPEALALPAMQGRGDYVELGSLDKKRQPGSLDFYAVTMLTMALLYSSMTGFWSVRGDMEQMTGGRTLCAPVKRYELLTGKVLGCILVTLVQGLVVILFSKFILKANWGNDLLPVALLLVSYSIMSVSLGVGLAYLFRSDAANGILNTIIPVIAFLGGSYVPLDIMGPAFKGVSDLSPVKWANTGLFRIIYDNDYSKMVVSVFINLAVAAAFILISALFSRKGTGKYA